MSLYYSLSHPRSPVPSRRISAARIPRVVGGILVIYLMPLILVVLTIGAVAVVVEKACKTMRSGTLR